MKSVIIVMASLAVAAGHASLIMPPTRNAIDSTLPEWANGKRICSAYPTCTQETNTCSPSAQIQIQVGSSHTTAVAPMAPRPPARTANHASGSAKAAPSAVKRVTARASGTHRGTTAQGRRSRSPSSTARIWTRSGGQRTRMPLQGRTRISGASIRGGHLGTRRSLTLVAWRAA